VTSGYAGQGIELGNLSPKKQMEVLRIALLEFEDALQFSPLGFRPGMGSANLATIKNLTKLGIHSGSLSIPPKKSSQYNYDWRQWSRVPHWVETPHGLFHNRPITDNLKIDNTNRGSLLNKAQENLDKLGYMAVYTHNWVNFSSQSSAAKTLNSLLS
jgi:hypothetical protein